MISGRVLFNPTDTKPRQLTNDNGKSTMNEDVFFPFENGNFQPVMFVFGGVNFQNPWKAFCWKGGEGPNFC